MALDESKDEDLIEAFNGTQFIMDAQTTDVLRQSGGLTIDYVEEANRRGYMLKLGNATDCGDSNDGGGCSGCG